MRKTIFILAVAVALTMTFVATAFADHSPDFYVSWNAAGPNTGTGSPHGNYQKNTVKCSVCHAVHRAAVVGMKGSDAAWAGQAATGPDTELLLRSTVHDACNYCHIQTAVGGVRIYNGNVDNVGNWVNSGYGHGNSCTDCHAVHGADTFKGAMITKDLKWDQYKGGGMLTGNPVGGSQMTANAAGPEHTFTNPDTGVAAQSTMQDEIFLAGTDMGGTSTHVAADNIPMFLGDTVLNVVNGTNLNVGDGYTNAHEAQGSAFCTQCHQNFSASSETVVNVDNEMALFSTWAGTYPGAWVSASAGLYTSKNHPMKPVTAGTWTKTYAVYSGTVAWADATYCRSCHDAGEVNANQNHAAGYVVENSYPHATPGYLDFMTAAPTNWGSTNLASEIGAATTGNAVKGAPGNKDSYADGAVATTPSGYPSSRWTITQFADVSGLDNYGSWYANGGTTKVWNDGSCLKCHATATAGVGKTF